MMKPRNMCNFILRWFKDMAISGIIICLTITLLQYCFSIQLNQFLHISNFSAVDAFYAQCSITFIIVSFISFLSGNTNDVLWDDTISYSLVNPRFTNFVSLSAALVADLLIAAILLFLNEDICTIISFFVSIVLMVIVTTKITGAFYSRDSILLRLKQEYSNEDSSQQAAQISLLHDKIMQQMEQKKYDYVKENIEFLKGNHLNQDLENALRRVADMNGSLFLSLLDDFSLLGEAYSIKVNEDLCERLIVSQANANTLNESLACLFGQYMTLIKENDHITERLVELCTFASESSDVATIEKILNFLYKNKKNNHADNLLLRIAQDSPSSVPYIISKIDIQNFKEQSFFTLCDISNELSKNVLSVNFTYDVYTKLLKLACNKITPTSPVCIGDDNYHGTDSYLKAVHNLTLVIMYNLLINRQQSHIVKFSDAYYAILVRHIIDEILKYNNIYFLHKMMEYIYYSIGSRSDNINLIVQIENANASEYSSKYSSNLNFDWRSRFDIVKYSFFCFRLIILSKLCHGNLESFCKFNSQEVILKAKQHFSNFDREFNHMDYEDYIEAIENGDITAPSELFDYEPLDAKWDSSICKEFLLHFLKIDTTDELAKYNFNSCELSANIYKLESPVPL